MSNLTGCEELVLDDLHGPSRVTPLTFALKAKCGAVQPLQLRLLDLEGSTLEDDGLQAIAQAVSACQTISTLHLARNNIGDHGARALAEALLRDPALDAALGSTKPHAGLQLLDLHSNHIADYGADGLANLLRLPAPPLVPVPLRELRLHDNRLGEGALRVLADALRDNVILETLMLSGNPAAGDAGIIALAHALHARRTGRDSALRRLFVARMNLTDASADALRMLLEKPNAPPLEHIAIDGNPMLSATARAALETAVQRRRSRLSAPSSAQDTGIFRIDASGSTGAVDM